MTIIKRMVCLANSRKLGGRCVAGKELASRTQTGKWIRPVSAGEQGGIRSVERRYIDGGEPRVLDVINVPLLYAQPEDYQTENWLLDTTHSWVKIGRLGWNDLEKLVDPDEPLWIDEISTFNGMNDEIPLDLACSLDSSLRLIRVDRLTISVFDPGAQFGNPKRRVQGRFWCAGVEYWLWVTDPDYEQKYLKMPDGNYMIGESFLTVSLGLPHSNASCYKLIAAIIERPGL